MMHFTLHLDSSTLLLLGVGAQLLAAGARHFFRRPAQQAQIDRIEAKVSDALAQVAPVLSALQTLNLQAAGTPTSPTPPTLGTGSAAINQAGKDGSL